MSLEGALKEHNAQFPQFQEKHEKMQDLNDRKLYHQLTDATLEYLEMDTWREKAPCKSIHALFEGFIRNLCTKVNPLRFQHILSIGSEHLESPQAALEFVQSFKDQVMVSVGAEANLGVNIFYRALQTDCMVAAKNYTDAQALLDEIEAEINKAYGVDASVHSRFYGSLMKLYEATKDHQQYFQAALNYLNYTPLASVQNPVDVAYNVILSCLVSPNEFDFGDLLHREILQSLENHPNVWAKHLLVAFHDGKYQAFDEALKNNADQINKVPELKANAKVLEQKFSLMALVELAFQQPKKHRKLDFKKIAAVCRVEQNRVEHLIMRAMSLSLIKGSIDQVNETLSFHWVKPRILDKQRLQLLQSRIDTWLIQVNSVLMQLEEMTPELLVS
eukprot:GEMP01039267.1.p1 GENE.GEMP01039267.1~~GEMP01039267.1.p1  ORF type:complete len:400 (+),score=86.73 GEMP01039267.1:35-1201(+)